MLKNHNFSYPTVPLEFEGQAVGMWIRNLAPENYSAMGLPYGEEIMIVCRTYGGTVHKCDRRTDKQTDIDVDRFTMTKTALCTASRGTK